MNSFKLIILLIALIIHLCLSVYGTSLIWKSIKFTEYQRRMNILFLWLFPFIWFLLVKSIMKRIPGSHEIKEKDDVTNNLFHESGKGSPWLNKY